MEEKALKSQEINPQADGRGTTLKKKRLWLWTSVVIGGGLSVWIVWWWFGQPAQGVFSHEAAPSEKMLTEINAKTEYTGKYFTFSYPKNFVQKPFADSVRPPLLEQAFWSKAGVESEKIALLYQDIGNFTIAEYPSYRMRTLDPNTYTLEQVEIHGLKLAIFTKKQPQFEVAAFFGGDGRVVSLALTSSLRLEGLREHLFEILESWVWVDEKRK